MENSYISTVGEYATKKIIEKSRFITVSRHVEGEEQAKSFVAEVKARNPDATHNCYAFVADELGNYLRFSDDGEPQGTAGMPILEVIRAQKLFCTAVVVTRYFGGIKLGAGGLVRAYSGCAAENLDGAQKAEYCQCAESVYFVDYPLADAARNFFTSADCVLVDTEYGNAVGFTVAVRKDREQSFNSQVSDALCGKVRVVRKREYRFPFPL